MSLRQTLVETLFNERWKQEDYNNLKLVLDKLKTLKNIHKIAKRDFIRVIQRYLP